MAPLFTKHDPYNVHKTLGALVLAHTLYRVFLTLRHGTAFPIEEPLWRSSLGVLLHGLLSWSSLLLPLPQHRNYSSPMMWPEFRYHSITFATRHVCCTLLTLAGAWPSNVFLEALAKCCVIYGVVKVVGWITDTYGDRERRTTNAMVYPKEMTEEQREAVKAEYAKSQFAATAISVLPDATLSWMSVIPIQAAPLLMTLVRKGKISTFTYHRVYSFTLWSNVLLAFCVFYRALPFVADSAGERLSMQLLLASGTQMLLRKLRLELCLPQLLVWTLFTLILFVVYPRMLLPYAVPVFITIGSLRGV